jgi:hypothetical protein
MPALGTTLWAVGGIAAVIFLSAGARLGRSGRHIPTPLDKGFQVFELALMSGIVINLAVELLR